MDLSAPLQDVAPGVRGALLQTLARLQQPVTRRQLAAAAGVTPGHATGVIDALVTLGLVIDARGTNSSLVSLNRSHLAAAPIIALAGLRGELIRRLRERLSSWPDLAGAWLFGSVARGDAREDSDIDVLVVAHDLDSSTLHERISGLQADVRSWTGNDLQLVEHTRSTWHDLARSGNSLVEQIRRDGIALRTDDFSLLARPR